MEKELHSFLSLPTFLYLSSTIHEGKIMTLPVIINHSTQIKLACQPRLKFENPFDHKRNSILPSIFIFVTTKNHQRWPYFLAFFSFKRSSHPPLRCCDYYSPSSCSTVNTPLKCDIFFYLVQAQEAITLRTFPSPNMLLLLLPCFHLLRNSTGGGAFTGKQRVATLSFFSFFLSRPNN